MVETAYKCKEINLSIYLHPFSTCIEFSIRDQDSESYTIKVSLTFIYYLAADRHICLACIVTMMKNQSLPTIFESKAMKPLNAVGSEMALWSNIFM